MLSIVVVEYTVIRFRARKVRHENPCAWNFNLLVAVFTFTFTLTTHDDVAKQKSTCIQRLMFFQFTHQYLPQRLSFVLIEYTLN